MKKHYTPEEIVKLGGLYIDNSNGTPICKIGDETFYETIYTFDSIPDRPWQEAIKSMYADGVRVFSFLLPLVNAWQPDGSFDFTELDALHDEIISCAPEGLFMPRVFVNTPTWWDEKHPDELLGFEHRTPIMPKRPSEKYHFWRYAGKFMMGTSNADWSSQLWMRDAGEALRAYVTHTAAKYPGRFIAYQIAYGTCGEWGFYGSYQGDQYGFCDFGKPTIRAFREFLKQKYGTDAELQKAWGKEDVKIDEVLPPSKLERHLTENGGLRTLKFAAKLDDWTQYSSGAVSYFCRLVKSIPLPYKVLAGSFGGSLLQTGSSAYMSHQHKNAHGFAKLVADTDIDFMATPNIYPDRANGVLSQVPVKSMTRNKLFLAECDVRTHLTVTKSTVTNVPRTPERALANLLFDSGYNLIKGTGNLWWYDFGNGWYLDGELKRAIAAITDKVSTEICGSRNTQNPVAVVFTPGDSILCEGYTDFFRDVRILLNSNLPSLGCGFDVITEDDIDRFPAYKLYIFITRFQAAGGAELRQKLQRNGSSAIWFSAAGSIREETFDYEGAAELTGIKLREVKGALLPQALNIYAPDDPLCAKLPIPCLTHDLGNTQTRYLPFLTVAEQDGVKILGNTESTDLPGLAVRRETNRFDVWSSTPKLPLEFYRNACLEAKITLDITPGEAANSEQAPDVQAFRGDRLIVVRSKNAVSANILSDVTLTDLVSDEKFVPENGVCHIALPNWTTRLLLKGMK